MSESKSQTQPKNPRTEQKETLEAAQFADSGLQSAHAQLMREKEEPTEGFSPIPIFLLFLFCGLTFWGGIYIEKFSGEFTAYAFDPKYREPELGDAPTIDRTDPDWLFSHGEKKFNQNCATCHQTSGMGAPGVYPPIAGAQWALGEPKRVINLVLYGLNGEITVKGNTYNGNMTAFGNHPGFRNDYDIAAVVSYIRNAWGNGASYVTADDVAAVRAEQGDRGPWVASDLADLYPIEN